MLIDIKFKINNFMLKQKNLELNYKKGKSK